MMQTPEQEAGEFGAFFYDPSYRLFKNKLFNYRLRKSRIEPILTRATGPILDVGCGISPMTPVANNVVLADSSFGGMRVMHGDGYRTAVIDISKLGFSSNSFSMVVCSEVLEHIPDDKAAIAELSRVLQPGGELVITVPIHPHYWHRDDEFAGHQRRYDLKALLRELRSQGFEVLASNRVGSVFERYATLAAAVTFMKVGTSGTKVGGPMLQVVSFVNLLLARFLDVASKLSPQALVSIQLIHCRKR